MNHPLDSLTSELTAFNSFRELVDSAPQYRPTILPRDNQHIDLADGYDAFQAERGDARRAWRGGSDVVRTPAVPSADSLLTVTLGGVPARSGLYSEWLRAIHEINGECGPDDVKPFGSPDSHAGADGSYIEEYPEYRVILRHTEWGNDQNSGTIEAKTPEAAQALKRALAVLLA